MTKLTTQEVEKIQNQILELKLKLPLSEKDKLKLHKLHEKVIRE